jgi:microcystin-dependent protein
MYAIYGNNDKTTLAANIVAGSTSLTVATGTGSNFPQPISGTQYVVATLISAANPAIKEIVYITGITGDVFTIQRAQEGTTALSWSAGDAIANWLTAGTLTALQSQILTLQSSLASANLNQTLLRTGTIYGRAYAGGDDSLSLICDGRSLLRSSYANLFTAIGTVWGSVDGTHFNIPDLRNAFLRGSNDYGANTHFSQAVGHAVGTYQNDSIQEITGTLGGVMTANGFTTSAPFSVTGSANSATVSGGQFQQGSFDLSASARTDTETRPVNAALAFAIYF